MNTPNNKRRQASKRKIENAFVYFIQFKDIHEVTVTEICREAGVNRTTFYANYMDIYDLSDQIFQKLEEENELLYSQDTGTQTPSYHLLDIVKNIYDNQLFYKTYFKLGRDQTYIIKKYDMAMAESLYHGVHLDYHMLFFVSGFNAILRKWLFDGCPFPPEEFMDILAAEYNITSADFFYLSIAK